MSGKILVIEDEPSVTELLCDVLQSEGFVIQSMDHPGAAHAIDVANPPDLILMDLMLPDESGIQLASQLRREGFAHTPMIAMSASQMKLHFAEESGLFQGSIAKPFEVETLIDAVRRFRGLYVA
jgi:two-component system, OmpR family, response regulator